MVWVMGRGWGKGLLSEAREALDKHAFVTAAQQVRVSGARVRVMGKEVG